MTTSIFKAYDVRGRYPSELDESTAFAIGVAFGETLHTRSGSHAIVGRDARLSSPELARAVSEGIRSCGIRVSDIGLCTTPMVYFAVNALAASGGAMVTASHNPPEYNGFKFVREHAIPIGSGSGLEDIRDAVSQRGPIQVQRRPRRGLEQRSVLDAYVRYYVERFSGIRAPSLVIDAGNGAVGAVLPAILDSLGIGCERLYFEPDGRFPHHEADPLKDQNVADLRNALANHSGSIGVAFDGDGDRVAFLDEEGERIGGDLATALIAQYMLCESGPNRVVYDVRSSRVVPETVVGSGGTPIRMRVGHVFMKHCMRENEALFGGELSSHHYFREFFYCDNGILAMLHLVRLLEKTRQTLRQAVAPLRKYCQSGELNYRVRSNDSCLRAVAQAFSDGAQDTLDGLSVTYRDWWFNLRASNTEPLVRLNVEAADPDMLRQKTRLVQEVIAAQTP